MSQKDLATELHISVETLSRMENGRRTISVEELEAIGHICKVPPEFMAFGFGAITDTTTEALKVPDHGALAGRVAALEAIAPTVTDQLSRLEGQLEDYRKRTMSEDTARELLTETRRLIAINGGNQGKRGLPARRAMGRLEELAQDGPEGVQQPPSPSRKATGSR